MTISINQAYDLALLAEVTYGDWDSFLNGSNTINQLLTGKNPGNKGAVKLTLSEEQAKYFEANFKVVAHKKNKESGFSGTLFRAKGNNLCMD